MDFLSSVDVAVFHFINQTISNPISDVLWPLITDYDKLWPVRIVLLGVWLWLLIFGGTKGRTAAIIIIPLLFLTDKVTSEILKPLIDRPRPCSEVDGVRIVHNIHLLVGCGPGKSFPSAHAVNNFAVATVFVYFYPKWKWAFIAWASLVALSRPAVGVHYPSDILGGAIAGVLLASLLLAVWISISNRFFSTKVISKDEPLQ